jgi:hypothetical protein
MGPTTSCCSGVPFSFPAISDGRELAGDGSGAAAELLTSNQLIRVFGGSIQPGLEPDGDPALVLERA